MNVGQRIHLAFIRLLENKYKTALGIDPEVARFPSPGFGNGSVFSQLL